MLTRGIVRELLLNAINHKDYATGVPIQVSVYEDKIVILNMGSWSKRVPTDKRVYEKHESVPNNPKIADVSFRSGDVESWGRGFLKIKAECKMINAPLPIIDAENGGVSVSAVGCEQYMSILQYGQVGADGVWRNKEKESKKTGDKKVPVKSVRKSDRSRAVSIKELFADYDCSKCRNCCKMYKGSIPAEDVEKDADYLGITVEQFIDFFLEKEEFGIGYHTKHKPCDFLQEDGNCKLGDCKPDSCKKYPYTDQPERLCSLLGMLDTISICPVAFEIFERLKKSTDLGRRRGTYEKRGIFRTMENII